MSEETQQPSRIPVALIIGGSGAIGLAIARKLADLELAVVIAARRPMQWTGEKPTGIVDSFLMDVTKPAQVSDAFAQLLERHGRLDLLVNAAGGASRLNPLLRMPVEDWEQQYAVHSRGALLA